MTRRADREPGLGRSIVEVGDFGAPGELPEAVVPADSSDDRFNGGGAAGRGRRRGRRGFRRSDRAHGDGLGRLRLIVAGGGGGGGCLRAAGGDAGSDGGGRVPGRGHAHRAGGRGGAATPICSQGATAGAFGVGGAGATTSRNNGGGGGGGGYWGGGGGGCYIGAGPRRGRRLQLTSRRRDVNAPLWGDGVARAAGARARSTHDRTRARCPKVAQGRRDRGRRVQWARWPTGSARLA